jgi:hypothetical protein
MTGADQLYRGRYGTHKLEVEMTGADQLYRGYSMVLTSWR